jgi:16S rRNA (uracil1498-N3)-methyltransferase
MSARRLFAPQLPAASAQLTLDEEARRHAQVLRLSVGDELRLFDARGNEADARVVRCDKRALVCDVAAPQQVPAPRARLHLAVCVPKAAKLELIVRMATELGVWSVQLIASEHAVPKYTSDAPKLERLQRIAIEACAQSEQAYAPTLHGPLPLSAALAALDPAIVKLVCTPRIDAPGVSPANAPLVAQLSAAEVWVLVGPEGGLSAAEQALLAQHDVSAISLGHGILRVETACVAACAQLLGCMREHA